MKSSAHSLILVLFPLFSFIFIDFIAVSQVTQKEILAQFKSNISIDPCYFLSSWDRSKDQCRDFNGVPYNSNRNLVKIVPWNTSLAGVLLPALSGLKSLRILTLRNRFTGNIPLESDRLKKLWKINLSSNALSGSIPDFLGDLSNIRLLDLLKNRYGGEIPSSLFKNCSKIKFVSLSHNNLLGSIPLSLTNYFNLLGIDLSFNNLSVGFPSQPCEIPSLAYLSLRSNVLTGSVQAPISSCLGLELLDLGTNLFTGSAPFSVLGFINLTYLFQHFE